MAPARSGRICCPTSPPGADTVQQFAFCQEVGGGPPMPEPEWRQTTPLPAPSLAGRADPSPRCKSTGGGGWVQRRHLGTAAGRLRKPQCAIDGGLRCTYPHGYSPLENTPWNSAGNGRTRRNTCWVDTLARSKHSKRRPKHCCHGWRHPLHGCQQLRQGNSGSVNRSRQL
jgi:hypothetical protein